MTIDTAMSLVRAAHDGITDRTGAPYWHHPVRVMQRLGDDTAAAKEVALLHDVLEDTYLSANDLIAAGFSSAVIHAVTVLTRDHAKTYVEYIHSIVASGNKLALRVKLADLADHLDPERIGAIPDSLIRRYRTAYATIDAAMKRKEQ